MKKIYYLMVAMLMAMTTLSLTACGDDEEDGPSGGGNDIVGTWKANLPSDLLYEVFDEEEIEYVDKAEVLIQFKNNETYVTASVVTYNKVFAELMKDNPYFTNPMVDIDRGTYRINGKKLITRSEYDEDGEEEVADFSISGKTMTFSYSDDGVKYSMKFSKVSDKEIEKYLDRIK